MRQCIALFRGLYAAGLDVEEVIRLCALEKLADRDSRKLSGGQQQRLLLAIALVNDPAVLFLDEPTTGLDPQARRNFWELVESIKARRKTIILTTHYMEEAELLCDEIVIMDHGRIVAQGPPRRCCRSTSRKCMLELPRQDFPAAARELELNLIEGGDRIEISTHDLEGTLRALMRRARAAGAPAHPARQPRGPVPGAHRQGAAAHDAAHALGLHARNLEFLRDRGTLIFTILLPIMVVIGMGFVFGGPRAPAVQGRRARHAHRQAGLPVPAERYVEFVAEKDVNARHAQAHAPAARPAGGYCTRRPLLGEHRLPEGLHRREAAAGSRPRRRTAAGQRQGGALRRLAVSRHPRHEHDVQLPVRGRLRGAALPQERLPEAPARHAAHRVRVPERAGALAPGADPVRHGHPLLRHRHDHRLPQRRQRRCCSRWSRCWARCR